MANHQHRHCSVLQAFGYNFEDLRINIGPMAQNGIQPVGSMGTDTPLAVLSDKPQLLYNYFKQLFAQVTNPPIDPIREELITSTTLTLGLEGNLMDPKTGKLPPTQTVGADSKKFGDGEAAAD